MVQKLNLLAKQFAGEEAEDISELMVQASSEFLVKRESFYTCKLLIVYKELIATWQKVSRFLEDCAHRNFISGHKKNCLDE